MTTIMEPQEKPALTLYKETRLDLEPTTPNAIIHMQFPPLGSFLRTTRVQRKVFHTLPSSKNDDDFKRRNVASSGSTYFRRSKKYPRSFLWRCLEENNVLEIRSIDLTKLEKDMREPHLILRFGFPSPIRNGCVALSDSTDLDVLYVFVVTRSNDLYTLTLRPDFFCRREASEGDNVGWYRTFKPPPFSLSTPHRLFASDPLVLLVSLIDGRIVRATRPADGDGSDWDARIYNDGHWGASLRGLIRWQGSTTVKHDGSTLDTDTAVAVSSSPDAEHIFAVCLNHTFRCWNRETGRLTFSSDVLNMRRDPLEVAKVMLNPGICNPLRIFETGAKAGDKYYLCIFSPHEAGLFKFWAVRDADYGEDGLRDLTPGYGLKAPDPGEESHWMVSDFSLKSDEDGMTIWVLLRLNQRYQLYHRTFDLSSLTEDDEASWSVTFIDAFGKDAFDTPEVSDGDARGVIDRWLEVFATPGRFTPAVMETALSIYIKSKNLSPPKSKAPLVERMAACVGSQVTFASSQASYGNEVNRAWLAFFYLTIEVHSLCREPLSLGFDADANMPWIVLGHGCCAVRECSELEKLALNTAKNLRASANALMESIEADETLAQPSYPDELVSLVEAAAHFRSRFSTSLLASCERTLRSELWQDAALPVPERLQSFYDTCNFANEVEDWGYHSLESGLKDLGGFERLSSQLFEAILNALPGDQSLDTSGTTSTRFGLKVLVKGAQDTIALHRRVLTDLLWLLVFVDGEVDQDETPLTELDVPTTFTRLLDELREMEVFRWLATHGLLENPRDRKSGTSQMTPQHSDMAAVSPSNANSCTILEDLFAVDMPQLSYIKYARHALLTGQVRGLFQWIRKGGSRETMSFDDIIVYITCHLIKYENVHLAQSFSSFLPSTAWATYVRGRLLLCQNQFTEAALLFRRAAYKLSAGRHQLRSTHHDPWLVNLPAMSAGLVDRIAAQSFDAGLAAYYSHVSSLFSSQSAHPHTASFARLALQFLPASPAAPQRSDMLAHLFAACLATLDFSAALAAVARYVDAALQRQAVATLTAAMIQHGCVNELLALPFGELAVRVEEFLVEAARKEASGLDSRRSLGVPIYRVLYAWRVARGDLRGAAAGLVEWLEGEAKVGRGTGKRGKDGRFEGAKGESKSIWGSSLASGLEERLLVVNALAAAGEDSWVFVGGDEVGGTRQVIDLGDARAAYQAEVDRRGVLESGRFGIVTNGWDEADDEMDMS